MHSSECRPDLPFTILNGVSIVGKITHSGSDYAPKARKLNSCAPYSSILALIYLVACPQSENLELLGRPGPIQSGVSIHPVW